VLREQKQLPAHYKNSWLLNSGSKLPGGKCYKAITLISASLKISFPDFNIVLRNKGHLKLISALKDKALGTGGSQTKNVHKEQIILLLV